MEDLRQSPQWGRYLAQLGWLSEGKARIRRLLLFSLIKYQRPARLGERELNRLFRLSKKHRALFIKIEPADQWQASFLEERGFRRDFWPLLAPKTLLIDLRPPLAKIRASLKKDARYCLRKAERNRLVCQIFPAPAPRELAQFYSLWRKTGKRGHFYIPSEKEFFAKARAFGKRGFLAQIGDLAGAYCVCYQGVCYYLHAGSSRKGQHLFAPYLCLWEVIKFAKKQNCQWLDLEGIYDPRFPRATGKWRGFTRFKRKWGGREKEFPGAYTRFVWFGWRR